MRILQVVTLLTPDNAYGGPLRVALNHVRELRAAGHIVDFVAGASGFDDLPDSVDGVQIRLFRVRRVVPGTGFAGLMSPSMLRHLMSRIRSYDVVHVHLARDLVTLPAAVLALLTRVPYVVQTHGMIDESNRRLARLLDLSLSSAVVVGACSVLYLTSREQASLSRLFKIPAEKLTRLPNGVPIPTDVNRELDLVDVLYLARLHPRKRPLEFLKAARELGNVENKVHFSLVGPDEGEGGAVQAFIDSLPAASNVTWEGAVGPEKTLDRMRTAAVYVLPSVDEPFPMSVLEAMALGLPVIITQSNGLAPYVKEYGAGIVIAENEGALVEPLKMLIDDPKLRARLGIQARRLVQDKFSISAVYQQLMAIYSKASVNVTTVDNAKY